MLFTKCRRGNQGFTLIEVLITIMVTGILAAIAAPSFLSWLNSKRIDDVAAQLEGAIKEAQKEAIKQSKPCTVNLGTTVSAVVTGTSNSCLTTGSRDLSKLGVKILSNNNSGIALSYSGGDTIDFSFKGTTTTDKVIVVRQADNSGKPRCLIITSGLGLSRSGNYTGSTPATPVVADCDTVWNPV
jgi:prepilin-type N-terminal cleavage/methylation domain-containing protein